MPEANSSLPRLILASASPRRKQILETAGYEIEVFAPADHIEEQAHADSPEELAVEKAWLKAHEVAQSVEKQIQSGARSAGPWLVIGSDTLCALDAQILEKPLDRNDAERILLTLSGTRHRVVSGLSLCPMGTGWPQGIQSAPLRVFDTTWVTMRRLSLEEVRAYVASGEADGKAGAYAIQERGDRFVEHLEGSFDNVVGFPLELFQREIHRYRLA